MTSQTVEEINAATTKSLAARTAEVAKAPRTKATPKATPKAAPKAAAPAPKPEPKPVAKANPRKALTPKERAAKPVTATVASYVEWLNREIFGGKMTKAQIEAAGVSITLYGNFQSSPERKAARGA
jgi:hypothetical protein